MLKMKAWEVMLKCKIWYMFPLSKFTTGWVSELVPCDISSLHEWADLVVWLLRLWSRTEHLITLELFFLYMFHFYFWFTATFGDQKSCPWKACNGICLIMKTAPQLLQENQDFKTKVINIALGSNTPSALLGNLDNCLSWFLSSVSTGH